jgi:cytochrome c peroxidase
VAAYERTVLLGDNLDDRAYALMRKRVTEEESGKFVMTAGDYAAALKDEFARKGRRWPTWGWTRTRTSGRPRNSASAC